MKLEAILLTVLAIAGTTLFFQENTTLEAPAQVSVFQQYQNWKAQFGQNTNGREDEYRFAIFQENARLAALSNARNTSFKLGVTNQFAAMTNEEFRAHATNQEIRTRAASLYEKVANTQILNRNAPSGNVDWVSKGAVQTIQNQGQCGSCWAFSAVSQLESFYVINGGQLQNWSEQQVVDCTPSPSEGCNGGWPEDAFEYVASNGMEQENAYPYTSGNSGRTGQCAYSSSTSGFIAGSDINTGYGSVPANNPEALFNQLQSQPISILVDGGSFVFQLYTTGIIDSDSCGNDLDHAISLTGYTSGSTPYWTVRNSWGTSWGEQGYAQIAYSTGNGYCGINMAPTYPTN